jgi:hypothetical protein
MEIHSLSPHMHYRGKSFRFEATYPNGSREILLDVPRYDFNWQNVYKFDEPKFIPEGTMLRCVAHFDNSEKNLSNPDPSIAVRWGEQTWDEMMLGYFEGVFLNQDLALPEPKFRALGGDRYRAQFTYKPDRPAKTVNVAGTFNDWNSTTHGLTDEDGDGIYTIDVIVRKGEHRYKFVIDSQYWTHDPDGKKLFVGGQEKRFEIWDIENKKLLVSREGQPTTRCAAFSADEKTLAVGGDDKKVLLADADTGETRMVLTGHLGAISAVVFADESRTLVSGCDRGPREAQGTQVGGLDDRLCAGR